MIASRSKKGEGEEGGFTFIITMIIILIFAFIVMMFFTNIGRTIVAKITNFFASILPFGGFG